MSVTTSPSTAVAEELQALVRDLLSAFEGVGAMGERGQPERGVGEAKAQGIVQGLGGLGEGRLRPRFLHDGYSTSTACRPA